MKIGLPRHTPKWRLIALVLLWVGPAVVSSHGETIVIGGGSGSLTWDAQYAAVSVIDLEAMPGFILPTRNGAEDNLSLKLVERGGTITSPNARVVLEISQSTLDGLLVNMADGRRRAFEMRVPSAIGIIFRIDLGERFGVNRIRFFPREEFEGYFLKGYELSLNDGSPDQVTLSGTPDLRVFKREERNLDPVIDIPVPLQFVRYIEVKQLVRGEWEIDEFEVFGEGFASSASYTSSVFDQGQPAVFGGLTWAMETIGEPTKVGATVSTQSGTTPDPEDELTWSGWSPPYPAGTRSEIASPAPRRYWQFQVQFRSSDILSAAVVDSIAIEVSPALADSVLGEIWPQSALIGQDTELIYWVRSFSSRGFDTLEISTLAPVEVIRSVRIDGADVAWERTDVPGGVRIGFPRVVGDRTLEITFDGVALQYNTVFSGKISDSQRPLDLPQVIVAGDASSGVLADGDDLSITIQVGGNLIHSLQAVPAPFTPNSDGVNDQTTVTYEIVNLTGDAPISVEIFDLTGARRRVLFSGPHSSGRFRRVWDGTDDGGQRLPPGIYIVRVAIAADTGTESKTTVAPLVY